jgi:GMP synthase (glutamine-hydrolysing)
MSRGAMTARASDPRPTDRDRDRGRDDHAGEGVGEGVGGGASTVLVVEHQADAGPGLLAPALRGAGLAMRVWSPTSGEPLPDDLRGHAGLAILGGSMSAYDGAAFPYLEDVMELIRRALAADVPTLGICLGAQLAALALGGEVTRRPQGPRLGWIPATGTGDDPLTAVLDGRSRLFCWHHDRYLAPPGAREILAGWDGFRLGSVCALQTHPEVTPVEIHDWCRSPEGVRELAEVGADEATLLELCAVHERHGGELLGRWCDEVRAHAERA